MLEFRTAQDRRPGAPRPPDAATTAWSRRRSSCRSAPTARVKAMTPRRLETMGAQIILGNTFHLWLRPGPRRDRRSFGGLHRFRAGTSRSSPTRGGFQVWSLGAMRKISEEGVTFASPVNGDKLFLTPEISMQIQTRARTRDIVMQFDECTPYEIEGRVTTRSRGAPSMELSPALGAALRATSSTRLENPNALVRHRAGRHVRGPARGVARGAGGDRLPRLRDRRRQRRRAEGGRCCASWRTRRTALPARQAALPDGRRHARGPGRGRGRTASTCSTA